MTLSGPACERPLSDGEAALWLLQQAFPDEGVANLAFTLQVPDHAEPAPLQQAVTWLVNRHPVLRSSVAFDGSRPVRSIREPGQLRAEIEVCGSSPSSLTADIRAVAGRPFDLEHDELMRFHLLELTDGTADLLVVAHHLIFDAASAARFVAELGEAYESFAATGGPPAAPAVAPAPASDQPPASHSASYWRDRLSGLRPGQMRLDGADYSSQLGGFRGRRLVRLLAPDAVRAVRMIRQRTRATDNLVMLAAYALLLHRHGADRDVVVGVLVSTRSPEEGDSIGHHFSVLPLRLQIQRDESFGTLVGRTLDAFSEALEHRDVSYETLANQLADGKYDWEAPFFRQLFNFWPARASDGWGGTVQQVDTGYSRFDLELVVGAWDDGYHIQLAYRTDRHDESFVRRFYDRYEALLRSAAADLDGPAVTLSIRTRHDQVIARANQTTRRWPAPLTVPAMIEEQILASAGRVALSAGDAEVTYERLGRAADDIRALLAAGGVGAGDVVATAMPRGEASAATALAAWRLGAAYLPLDPSHPVWRLRFQLRDAAAAALVASADTIRLLDDPAGCVITEHDIAASQARRSATPPAAPGRGASPGPADLAYVIYTSGSTGTPKGVQITHANLANVVRHFAQVLDFRPGMAMVWLTTFAFDISALELFLPLVRGGRVVVADDLAQADARRLAELVRGSGADVIQATPTTWRLIADVAGLDLTGRWVLSGGEPLTSDLAERIIRTGARLMNVYGPSETTIWSTATVIDAPGAHPPVGAPIANTTVEVIDGYGNECPVGIAGVVVIGGAGVAAGYLGQPELTSSRFVQHRHGRSYLTGDLGLWRADGQLELHGRADRQVKIHGFRLELGEVEAVLESHSAVTAAAVVASGSMTGPATVLVAFVVTRAAATEEDLWSFARQRLANHAAPGRVFRVASLPRNSSGKIDYLRLPDPGEAERDVRHALAAPAGAASAAAGPDECGQVCGWLTSLWRGLLENSGLHADSNLFLSGGDSLLVVGILDQIRSRYDIDVPMVVVLNNPTPRGLSSHLTEALRLGQA